MFLSTDSIKNIGHTVGVYSLKETVAAELSSDVEYRLRELIQDALKFTKHSRRTRLTQEDINSALDLHGKYKILGHVKKETPKFQRVIGDQELFYLDEKIFELEEVINAPLPLYPRNVSFSGHWLAVDGIQPRTLSNPQFQKVTKKQKKQQDQQQLKLEEEETQQAKETESIQENVNENATGNGNGNGNRNQEDKQQEQKTKQSNYLLEDLPLKRIRRRRRKQQESCETNQIELEEATSTQQFDPRARKNTLLSDVNLGTSTITAKITLKREDGINNILSNLNIPSQLDLKLLKQKVQIEEQQQPNDPKNKGNSTKEKNPRDDSKLKSVHEEEQNLVKMEKEKEVVIRHVLTQELQLYYDQVIKIVLTTSENEKLEKDLIEMEKGREQENSYFSTSSSSFPSFASSSTTTTNQFGNKQWENKLKIMKEKKEYHQKCLQIILNDLSQNSGIIQLVPYFIQFIASKVRIYFNQISQLITLMKATEALVMNPSIKLERYLHQLIPSIMTCALSVDLERDVNEDHWEMREYAAQIIAKICSKYRRFPALQPNITSVLVAALVGKNKRPLASQYGAIVCLQALGKNTINMLLLPNIEELLSQFEKIINQDKQKQQKKIHAIRCKTALINAIGNILFDQTFTQFSSESKPFNSLHLNVSNLYDLFGNRISPFVYSDKYYHTQSLL
ncbi:transcription initiation factor tfiid subunit 6 [Anaeramoeba flamelloides]|uniref:Transcription initiation factor tfiid subunit 6 n=1 Tax=Anaeramoeba flamelloides TaxID=1746091 RepID=A0ABQ8Y5Z6_9EUKA|nr:transcription initiation factor tfiid subunit 6 [Anaeramoeba flamelloides]